MTPMSHSNNADVRCHCGSLGARVIGSGIELKCRRCKRVLVVVNLQHGKWTAVSLHPEGHVVR